MARVKIEDLKPESKKLDAKEMKKLFGGLSVCGVTTVPLSVMTKQEYTAPLNVNSIPDDDIPALTTNLGKF